MRARYLLLPTLIAGIGCAMRPTHVLPDLPFPPTTMWRVPPSPSVEIAAEQRPLVGPLATDGSAVFVVTDIGVVRALELASGETRWEASLTPGVLSAADGVVFLRHAEGGVEALDAKTGAVLWQSRAGSPGAIPAAPDGERVVVLGRAASALNTRSGEKLWTTRGLGTFSTAPLIAGDRLVAGTHEGALHCLDLATGKPLWKYQTAAPLLAAPIADQKGRVFVGTGDGRVVALGLRSGKHLWEWRTGVATDYAGVLYKDLVLVASNDAILLGLSRGDGHLAWRATLPSRPVAPPVIQGDVLFATCYGTREKRTTLMAVDLVTVRRLGNIYDTEGESQMGPLFLDDRMVFAFRDRSVAVLALAKAEEVLGKGFARRRKLRDLGLEGTPTPTPTPRR